MRVMTMGSIQRYFKISKYIEVVQKYGEKSGQPNRRHS